MTGTDIIVAYIGIVTLFLAAMLIGYELLKKHGKENEHFRRNHVEDAMRIKAKQYQNNQD
jgi:hypothetical protein